MLSSEQVYERGHDLAHGEAGQRVLVAHHQQLAHLDDGLQLLALIARRLQPRQQLGGFRCGCRSMMTLIIFVKIILAALHFDDVT